MNIKMLWRIYIYIEFCLLFSTPCCSAELSFRCIFDVASGDCSSLCDALWPRKCLCRCALNPLLLKINDYIFPPPKKHFHKCMWDIYALLICAGGYASASFFVLASHCAALVNIMWYLSYFIECIQWGRRRSSKVNAILLLL